MCDTIYFKGNGKSYFGKNSDRSPNEAHLMIREPERNFEKGVDFRRKCGIINKLSRKTAALQKPNKAMYQQKRSGEPDSVRVESF